MTIFGHVIGISERAVVKGGLGDYLLFCVGNGNFFINFVMFININHYMMKWNYYIIICICISVLCSCRGGSELDVRFQAIDRLCDSIPEAAIDSLAAISSTGLSEKELNRYRLLWIKSRDKAYIAHKSDSLILDVIDYYDRHRSEGMYPEALYYGGRVYADLGDLPTALEFFQKSLDEIPEDEAHLRFRSIVLNQTGRILQALRLNSAAIEYLKKSLVIETERQNNYGRVFTHNLIAKTAIGQKHLNEARRHMDEAIRLSSELSLSDRQSILCSHAELLLCEGNVDSALIIIRNLPKEVDNTTLPFCLAVATQIYKDAGILDTAYMYARQLTRLPSPNNKKTGYLVIFSDEMRNFVPNDTLRKLIPEYKQVIEDYLNSHEAEQALIQNSRYNYSKHDRDREDAERKLSSFKENVWFIGGGLLLIMLSILSIVLWRRYRKSWKDSKLMEGFILTERLKEEIEQSRIIENKEKREGIDLTDSMNTKQRILDEIETLKKDNHYGLDNNKFIEYPLYRMLKERAENKEPMGKEVSWMQIEDLIKGIYPDFDLYLTILTQNQISAAERKVAMLMKLGFSNTQIADLLNRQPATVSRQRTSIASKIGCDKSAVDTIVVRL